MSNLVFEKELNQGLLFLPPDEIIFSRPKQHPLTFLLKSTGLYFGDRKNRCFWYCFGVFRGVLLCCLVTYQVAQMVYKLAVKTDKPNGKTVAGICMCSLYLQGALAILFLIYWQLRGHIDALFTTITWPSKKDVSTLKCIRFIMFFLAFASVFLVGLFGFVIYVVVTEQYEYLIADVELLDAYHTKALRPLVIIIYYFGAQIWHILLIFYVIFCVILHGKFRKFNNELSKLNQANGNLSEHLLEKYSNHIQMAKMVQTVNSTFEVYTFAMLGLNIPTTVFSLISLFTAKTMHHILLISSVPMFCIFNIIGLTAIPAKVHSAIQHVRNALYNNTNIWRPYDEKTYQIASVFVSHIDHANLGISVWGFAIVTKPLILTTISLTITYLTILLQLQINDNDES